MLVRPTLPALRGVVEALWATDTVPGNSHRAGREFVLPDGRMHLAIRLGARPLRLYADRDDSSGLAISDTVVAGPYTRAYLKDLSEPGPSVGAIFRVGAAQALFGCEPAELIDHHWPLAQFGSAANETLRDRLNSEVEPLRRLQCLQELLSARLRRAHGLHPHVAQSLQELRRGAPIGELVAASGYSHRRFLDLFRRAAGMSPKRYARLVRFRRVLAMACGDLTWTEVALAGGYSDQAHLIREFREFSGLTPQAYRQAARFHRRHVTAPLAR